MDFQSNLAMFTIVEAVIGELVNDGTIVKQQKESTSDDSDRYEVTQNLDKICKDFRHRGLSF